MCLLPKSPESGLVKRKANDGGFTTRVCSSAALRVEIKSVTQLKPAGKLGPPAKTPDICPDLQGAEAKRLRGVRMRGVWMWGVDAGGAAGPAEPFARCHRQEPPTPTPRDGARPFTPR